MVTGLMCSRTAFPQTNNSFANTLGSVKTPIILPAPQPPSLINTPSSFSPNLQQSSQSFGTERSQFGTLMVAALINLKSWFFSAGSSEKPGPLSERPPANAGCVYVNA